MTKPKPKKPRKQKRKSLQDKAMDYRKFVEWQKKLNEPAKF